MSVPTAKRALRSLEDRGHLIINSGQGRHITNDYFLRQKGVSGEPFSSVTRDSARTG